MIRNVGFWFFAVAAICALIGMGWGIQMSATHNHVLSPAHGHLNLVGWVTMAFFGLFYKLVPQAGESLIAKVHLGVALLGLISFVPGIAMAISGQGETLVKIGSALIIFSMLIFIFNVFKYRDAFSA
ncbi:hypothetical protein [Maritalea porphyrae]|jgi:hypothetical protein|uniref:hypothetical protein n=1 Tax=Maritalea porphyrae TaxID=880732 RepID=UPI0022AE93B1|nr:hypothetical protein [Maritalea porphyrae]MCZ4274192.1 hypothetical protein [Maritalea porphyrae]